MNVRFATFTGGCKGKAQPMWATTLLRHTALSGVVLFPFILQ